MLAVRCVEWFCRRRRCPLRGCVLGSSRNVRTGCEKRISPKWVPAMFNSCFSLFRTPRVRAARAKQGGRERNMRNAGEGHWRTTWPGEAANTGLIPRLCRRARMSSGRGCATAYVRTLPTQRRTRFFAQFRFLLTCPALRPDSQKLQVLRKEPSL